MTSLRGVQGDGGDFGAQGPKKHQGWIELVSRREQSGMGGGGRAVLCNFVSFWVRICAARTHTVPVSVAGRKGPVLSTGHLAASEVSKERGMWS